MIFTKSLDLVWAFAVSSLEMTGIKEFCVALKKLTIIIPAEDKQSNGSIT